MTMLSGRSAYTSRTVANVATKAADAPTACKKRRATKGRAVEDAARQNDAAAKRIAPLIRTGRRPMRSEIGPKMIWPSPSITM